MPFYETTEVSDDWLCICGDPDCPILGEQLGYNPSPYPDAIEVTVLEDPEPAWHPPQPHVKALDKRLALPPADTGS